MANLINMDGFHRDLKMQTEACYMTIKEANEKLDIIRSKCLHPETKFVDYEYRIGRIEPNTEICAVCGDRIRK